MANISEKDSSQLLLCILTIKNEKFTNYYISPHFLQRKKKKITIESLLFSKEFDRKLRNTSKNLDLLIYLKILP